ncbi:hypothetical protein [Rhizobium sullae]|uniref:VOC family protein n=1 Tax=Rhizobium sullae TaxID=50338 RepID=UPI0031451F42
MSRLTERLEDGGFRTITDQPLDGCHRRYVSDPFGNRLELMERARIKATTAQQTLKLWKRLCAISACHASGRKSNA